MRLINDDCINAMNTLIDEDIKVDLILTDPPYGTTHCRWDNIIPFEPMWECINQLSNERTPCLLFNTEPFGSKLRLSNLKNYKYDWIWNKNRGTNFLNANRTPLPCHENISVFYKKLPKYKPQKKYVGIKRKYVRKESPTSHEVYGKLKKKTEYVDDGYRFPLSVINCNPYHTEATQSNRVHPTQKPVALLEYLIKTYTNENDLVLDFCMGSGSTGVACQNLNRDFIGIELEPKYHEIAVNRIKENKIQQRLL